MIELIVAERYETIPGLKEYDVEDFIDLFEIVYVSRINKLLMTRGG